MPEAQRSFLITWVRPLAALLLLLSQPTAGTEPAPLVAVAASMTGAAGEIAGRFREDTGIELRLSFGASGNLARQILRGAPFQLFISADTEYPRRLHEAGLTDGPPRPYATGKLALYLSPSSDLMPARGDDGERVRAVLADRSIERLAIANPSHAPYGRAARQALEHLSLWQAYQGRLVIGENVTQAARFARTRTVPAALLPVAVVLEPTLADGPYVVVPSSWHDPIDQHLVVLRGAGAAARRFARYLLGDTGRTILARRGFALVPRD